MKKENLLALLFTLSIHVMYGQTGNVLSYSTYGRGINGFNSTASEIGLGFSATVVGDIDGNGILDIAARGYNESSGDGLLFIALLNINHSVKNVIRISQNQGGFPNIDVGGTFGIVCPLGDLNKDGIPDISIGDPANNAIYLCFLNRNGSLKNVRSFTSSDLNLSGNVGLVNSDTIGDFNNDGVIDLLVTAVSANESGSFKGAAVIVCLNSDGSLRDQYKISSTSGNFYGQVNESFGRYASRLGDLNNDGVVDLLVTSTSTIIGNDEFWILFLNSNGTVKSYQKISTDSGNLDFPIYPYSSFGVPKYIGDVNGDGNSDIAIAISGDTINGKSCGSIRILLLNSNGTVKESVKLFSDTSSFYDKLGNGDLLMPSYGGFDYDGNYRLDIMISAPYNDFTSTNGGLFFLASIDGTIHPVQPQSRFTAKDTTGLITKTFTFTNTSSGYPKQVKWSFTPNTVIYQNGTTETSSDSVQVKFTNAGTYSVKLWVQNPFGRDSLLKTNYITVSPIGGSEETANIPFSVYPIPATGELQLSGASALNGSLILAVQNYIGETIITEDRIFGNQSTEKIDVALLPQGLYLLTIHYNNTSYTLKFIK